MTAFSPLPSAREERADHRRDRRDAADREREEVEARVARAGERAEEHHGDRGDRVGLEQVGGHAGAVADVVADVVGDHGRVARVVLGDAGLDLADEVGADVGGLREDAAAEAGEDRDQRAAEGEADEIVDRRVRRVAEPAGQEPVVAGDAEQAEADDEQARHRAGAEGDVQRGLQPAARRLGGAAVRAHGDVHADEAGGRRQHGADQEAERRAPAELVVEAEHEERHDRDDRDRRVLLLQVGRSALLNGAGDLAHPLVAGRLLEQPPGQIEPVAHGHAGTDEAEEHGVMHEPVHQFCSLTKSSAEGLRRGRLCITILGGKPQVSLPRPSLPGSPPAKPGFASRRAKPASAAGDYDPEGWLGLADRLAGLDLLGVDLSQAGAFFVALDLPLGGVLSPGSRGTALRRSRLPPVRPTRGAARAACGPEPARRGRSRAARPKGRTGSPATCSPRAGGAGALGSGSPSSYARAQRAASA